MQDTWKNIGDHLDGKEQHELGMRNVQEVYMRLVQKLQQNHHRATKQKFSSALRLGLNSVYYGVQQAEDIANTDRRSILFVGLSNLGFLEQVFGITPDIVVDMSIQDKGGKTLGGERYEIDASGRVVYVNLQRRVRWLSWPEDSQHLDVLKEAAETFAMPPGSPLQI